MALADFLKDDIPVIRVEKTDALRFLRGEPFDFEKKSRGWRLISYLEQQLGWVKLLDNRMNNYYPKSWRIRH
jgi:NOL1/NOP2/fmu family ribosome biogenesis protein